VEIMQGVYEALNRAGAGIRFPHSALAARQSGILMHHQERNPMAEIVDLFNLKFELPVETDPVFNERTDCRTDFEHADPWR